MNYLRCIKFADTDHLSADKVMISFQVKNPSVQLQRLRKPSCQRERHVGLLTCTDPCTDHWLYPVPFNEFTVYFADTDHLISADKVMISFQVKNPSVQLQSLRKPSCQRERHVDLFTCTDPCVHCTDHWLYLPYVFTLTLGHIKGHATFDVTWNLYVVLTNQKRCCTPSPTDCLSGGSERI